MITQSIRNIRRMELSEVRVNKETGEANRTLDLETTEGRINILLVTNSLNPQNLSLINQELKQIS